MLMSKILILKALLVSILIVVAILSLPILIDKGNTHFKHALEWNYFVGVILFYLLTYLFWKKYKSVSFKKNCRLHTFRCADFSFGSSLMRYRQASRSTILALLSGTFCPLSLNLSVFP